MKLNSLCLFILGVLAYNHLSLSTAQSWDSYIDDLIARSKDDNGVPQCDKACIIAVDGGAILTTDKHPNAFMLTSSEAAAIASCFKSESFMPCMTDGIICERVKYQFLREEWGKIVFAKKKGEGAITLQASKTAIVIGHVPEGGQQGNLNVAVAAIAEYLESLDM